MSPTDDDVKEVYAQFGLAYYFSEVLHRGLCNLYAFSRASRDAPISRPRIEEHLKDAQNSTFGGVVNLVLPYVPIAIRDDFHFAISHRNFLAHHFWYDRIHLLATSAGCMQAGEELAGYGEAFQTLDYKIQALLEPLFVEMGFAANHMVDALEQVLADEDPPLIKQRDPLKEEVVIAVYEVGHSQGMFALIFEMQDHTFWQLCDAGLGWTSLSAVGSDWVTCARFDGLLPAHINPRPKCSRPWDYKIFLGKAVSLVVRPASGDAPFRWSLRRKASN